MTKSSIPFVSIGHDHACEHLNKIRKIHAGIIGISNNPNERKCFFLASADLSNLAKDFEDQFLKPSSKSTCLHHELTPGKIKRENTAVTKLK